LFRFRSKLKNLYLKVYANDFSNRLKRFICMHFVYLLCKLGSMWKKVYTSNDLEEDFHIVFECDDVRYNENIKVLCV